MEEWPHGAPSFTPSYQPYACVCNSFSLFFFLNPTYMWYKPQLQRWKKGHMDFPLFHTILSTICFCVILSFLSYLRLRLLVSPRSQQQLHNCGVTMGRGRNESSVANPLYIEGEGGTHHSSKGRKRGEDKRDKKREVRGTR